MKHILTILTALFLFGCNTNPEKKFENDKIFPKVKKLGEFEKTIFLPTLETRLDIKKNGIYAASLLMAWNEIENEIAEPIKNFDSKELALMNSSDSYYNVLAEDEYITSVEIQDLTIRVEAYFKKSLPFEIPLDRDVLRLQFLNDKVVSFGFYGHNRFAKILYYNNDDDFAIKLLPKDREHEIILMKSKFSNEVILKSQIERLEEIEKSFKENKNDKNFWKHYLKDEDRVRIPIIEFNIETNYSEIEGSFFSTDSRRFIVETAYQRTAFILNEKGAEVESESVMEVAEAIEEEMPKPKKMIFDKPYLILLKRKDNKFPYFAMFVSNSELMIKE